MNLIYVVRLSDTERLQLKQLVSSGTAPARKVRRAQILLKSDQTIDGAGWTYEQIRTAFDVSAVTIANTRKDYLAGGLEAALNRQKPEREYERCFDGEGEAHLIALTCSQPPEGHRRWTLRLLQERCVKLGYADHLSHETVRTTLKKMNSSRGRKSNGAFLQKPARNLFVGWKTY
jgi:hypothetical protein